MAGHRESSDGFSKVKLQGSLLLIDGDMKKRQQFAELANLVVKPASALERMKSFLPQMAAANSVMDAELTLNPASYNMEEVEGVEGPLIEMNVALVDMGDKNEEEEEESSDVDSGASVDDSSSDSDNDDDDQSEKPSMTEKNFRIKLEARRRRPLLHPIIEVLGGDEEANSPPSSEEGLGACSASEDSSPSPRGGVGESSSGCSDDDSARCSIGATRDGGTEDGL